MRLHIAGPSNIGYHEFTHSGPEQYRIPCVYTHALLSREPGEGVEKELETFTVVLFTVKHIHCIMGTLLHIYFHL